MQQGMHVNFKDLCDENAGGEIDVQRFGGADLHGVGWCSRGVGWRSEWGELTFKLRVRCMARYVEEVLQMQWGRFRC